MRIDWFTLIAQIVNFLVLIWLLKHFLYDQIVQAMNEREQKIVSRLEEAAAQRTVAEQEKDEYRAKQRELDQQREQTLTEARQEAESARQQLLEAARTKAESAQEEWLASLQREQRELMQDFRERLGEQVFSLTRHALKELSDAELEQKIIDVFLKRLKSWQTEERDAFVKAVHESGDAAEVRTGFKLSTEGQTRLRTALHEQFERDVDVSFQTVPDLICGVELRAQSQRLEWNLDSYLAGLEDHVFQVLEESASKHAKSK